MAVLGRASGMLAYIEYLEPSPLTYNELIWMPCLVSGSGARRRGRGYYVAVMYVDDTRSLAAGREIWKLPKTLARFDKRPGGVDIVAEDGTEISLDFRSKLPAVPLRSKMATLQAGPEGLVRFSSKFSGRGGPATVRVRSFSSDAPAWNSFHRAKPLPRLGARLEHFDSRMEEPVSL